MNEAASTEFSRLSLAMKIRSLGVYYPTLAYNVLLGRILNVRPWWTRIDDDLILGALPFASDVAKLHAEGVRGQRARDAPRDGWPARPRRRRR